MPWLCIIFNLRIFNLEEKRPLFCLWIKLFCHTITRPTNFNRLFEGNLALVRLRESRGLLGLASSSLGQIGLVSLPLCMRQVIPLIVVQCQAKFALIASEMVAHKIGIFSDIDGFEGKSSQPLTPVYGFILGGGGATATRLRTPLSVHLRPLSSILRP